VLFGIIYPIFILALGQVVFPVQSNGSIVEIDGRKVGARPIGQEFTRPEYFHPRPSRAGDEGYDALSSSASNLGPTNRKLLEAVNSNAERILEENPGLDISGVPVDAVTSSASGLDPHISPENAEMQAHRVAKARGISMDAVRSLIGKHTERPPGVIPGDPAVNVLLLNMDLDRYQNGGRHDEPER
jgi:K+-transporting ATPase ATPase C chain